MGKVKSRRQKYHASAARLKKNDANRIAESADSDMKEEQDVMQSDKVMKIIIYNFCYITTDLLIATDVVYVWSIKGQTNIFKHMSLQFKVYANRGYNILKQKVLTVLQGTDISFSW